MKADFDEAESRQALTDVANKVELRAGRQRRRRVAAVATGACGVVAAAAVPLVVVHSHRAATSNASPTYPTAPRPCSPRGYPVDPSPAGPRAVLVPAGPAAAQICRYAGFGETTPPSHLAATRQLTADRARQLAAALNSGNRLDTSKPAPSCPDDRGANDNVTFTYGSRPPVIVVVSLQGCQLADNGSIKNWTTQDARQLLATLVGTPRMAPVTVLPGSTPP